MLRSIDEGGIHVALLSVAKVGISEQQLFFEDHLKDFANDRREADGSELPRVCCASGFCDWDYLRLELSSSGAL